MCVCELALILSLCMENLLRAHVEQINDAAAGKRDGTTCRAAAVAAPVVLVAPVVVPATLLSISTHTDTLTHIRTTITTTAAVVRFWLWLSARLIKNAKKRLKANSEFGNAYKIDMMHGQSSPEFVPISLSLPPFQILFMRAAAFHQISKCGGKFVPRLHNTRNL